jgi:hypothetical protein
MDAPTWFNVDSARRTVFTKATGSIPRVGGGEVKMAKRKAKEIALPEATRS